MDPKYAPKATPLHLFVLGGFFYISGAFIYVKKWPESSYKIRFDMLGNSHNIFHLNCIIGALLVWWGSIKVFHER
jgi:adiponectin receptor